MLQYSVASKSRKLLPPRSKQQKKEYYSARMSSFSGVGGSGDEPCRRLRQTHRVGVEEIHPNLTLLLLSNPLLELLWPKPRGQKRHLMHFIRVSLPGQRAGCTEAEDHSKGAGGRHPHIPQETLALLQTYLDSDHFLSCPLLAPNLSHHHPAGKL